MSDTAYEDLDDAAFRAFLVATAPPAAEMLEERRARLNGRADTVPLPTDCEVELETVAGVDGERLRPVGASAEKLLLYFHGGGYQVGSPKSHRFLAARLADLAACEAYVPDYAKSPETPFPGAVDDALAVYRQLSASGQVVLGGDSAGGGLALALAVAAREAGLPRPAGLLLISPWADLAHEGQTYDRFDEDTTSMDGLRAYAQAYAGSTDLKNPLVSPLYADLARLPPMLIQVGTSEALLSDSTRLAAKAAAARVEVSLHAIPGLVHGFSLYFPQLASVRRAYLEAGGWLRERFGA